MGDTNQVRTNFVPEATPGTTPATPAFRRFRYTGAPDLAFAPSVVTSNEIVPGRQVQDTILVGAEAGGGVNFELVAADHDVLLEGAMFSAWVEQTAHGVAQSLDVTGGDFTYDSDASGDAFAVLDLAISYGFLNAANNDVHVAQAGTNATTFVSDKTLVDEAPAAATDARLRKIGHRGASGEFALTVTGFANLTSSGFSFTADGQFIEGAWVKVSGFSTSGANGWYRIAAGGVASGQLTFDSASHTPAADTGVGDTADVYFGDWIVNGSTPKAFTIEQVFSDMSPVTYQYFRGMYVDGLSLALQPQSIATGALTFRGFSAELRDDARFTGATDLTPLLRTPYNTSSNVGAIRQAGAVIVGPSYVLEASIELANNLRFNQAVGVLGAASVGSGEFGVTGKLDTYFGSKAIAQKVVDGTETSFDIRLEDIDGGAVVIDIPRVKFTAGAPRVAGKNESVNVPLEYQGLARLGVTTSYTILINRFWGTAA